MTATHCDEKARRTHVSLNSSNVDMVVHSSLFPTPKQRIRSKRSNMCAWVSNKAEHCSNSICAVWMNFGANICKHSTDLISFENGRVACTLRIALPAFTKDRVLCFHRTVNFITFFVVFSLCQTWLLAFIFGINIQCIQQKYSVLNTLGTKT